MIESISAGYTGVDQNSVGIVLKWRGGNRIPLSTAAAKVAILGVISCHTKALSLRLVHNTCKGFYIKLRSKLGSPVRGLYIGLAD